LQRDIHQDFIDLVKRSRGTRLKGPEKTLFSGEYWTGGKAIELGLADGIGDLRATLRARFGEDVVTPLMTPARGWFGRVQPGVDTTHLAGLPRAADFAEEAISALEARALWARYGL
jgi:ClpP class serine protease